MAKKKKDDLENNDELNEQNHDEFNEADDSFGLPDVDYQPLDEIEEEPIEEEVASPEEDSSTEEVYATTSYSNDYESESSDEESDAEETQEYVPGSYTPPEDENSNVGKVILLVLIVVIAGLGIWYFGFHKPEADRKEAARIEQERKAEEARVAQQQKEEAERRAREEEERRAAEDAAEQEAAEPETGVVNTISERTGRYYVVVASAIDGDLALDFANKLASGGRNIDIIPPFGKSKFHRVTVESQETWAAAENSASDLKGEFGDDVWVIRY